MRAKIPSFGPSRGADQNERTNRFTRIHLGRFQGGCVTNGIRPKHNWTSLPWGCCVHRPAHTHPRRTGKRKEKTKRTQESTRVEQKQRPLDDRTNISDICFISNGIFSEYLCHRKSTVQRDNKVVTNTNASSLDSLNGRKMYYFYLLRILQLHAMMVLCVSISHTIDLSASAPPKKKSLYRFAIGFDTAAKTTSKLAYIFSHLLRFHLYATLLPHSNRSTNFRIAHTAPRIFGAQNVEISF